MSWRYCRSSPLLCACDNGNGAKEPNCPKNIRRRSPLPKPLRVRYAAAMKSVAGFVVMVVLLVILPLSCSLRTVPAGHVGVVDLFGRVSDGTLSPGLHLVNPLASVHRMSVQTREIKEVMDTPSSEGLVVHLEISLIFHLDPAKAVEVYKTVGLRYDAVLIAPNVRRS